MQERQEARVQSLGLEDPLEKEMATHSGILAWKVVWTEELSGLQSMGSQEVPQWVGLDWAHTPILMEIQPTLPYPYTCTHPHPHPAYLPPFLHLNTHTHIIIIITLFLTALCLRAVIHSQRDLATQTHCPSKGCFSDVIHQRWQHLKSTPK